MVVGNKMEQLCTEVMAFNGCDQAAIARLGAYNQWKKKQFLTEILECLHQAEEEILCSETAGALMKSFSEVLRMACSVQMPVIKCEHPVVSV